MTTALNVIIRMIIVIGVLLMLAFDKFPKDNEFGVSQQNFLIALAILAFLYYFAQLARTPVMRAATEGMDGETVPQVMTLDESLSDASATGANIHHIRIFDAEPGYSPETLDVKVGDIVVWTNVGELEHTVTSARRADWMLHKQMNPGFKFDSGLMRPGQTFAMKFTSPGFFPYYCIFHEGWMKGEINVL